jgi:uncharacterized protein with GYD domain
MAKYLIKGSYTSEGVKGIVKEGGSGRRNAVEQLVQSAGGKVEAVYWALGEADVYVILELPDNATAAALSMAVNAVGAIQTRTVALLTAEEIDTASKQSLDYRPPGG